MTERRLPMALALVVASARGTLGCSNFLVSRGATTDNSTHLAYNSDGESFYGYMTHLAAGAHAKDSKRQIYEFGTGRFMGEIPEASTTYNVIGNMNQHQVAIGETTFDGIASLANQPGAIIDYYSLMWLALQRSTTAREAIATMDNLTTQYGYASTGESFSVSDPTEIWHMEFIGKGPGEKGAIWVARRVPDGYVSAHANQARITTWPRDDPANTLFAADVVEFAVKKKLYPATADPLAFDFSEVYDPVTAIGARYCEARVWELFRHVALDAGFAAKYLDYAQGANLTNRMPLFVETGPHVALNTTFWQMRRHYETSWFDTTTDVGAGPYHSVYRARPLSFEVDGTQYAFNRNIGYVGTFFHFVACARPKSTGVIWFGVDDPSFSVLVPMYSVTSAAPESWAYGNGNTGSFALRAAYWAFNVVSNFAMARFDVVGVDVQGRVAATEARLLAAVNTTDGEAADIAATQGPAAAVEHLTNFSIATANDVVDEWVELFPALMVRYRDGLIVGPPTPPAGPKDLPPPPDCAVPGYDEAWYRRIVKDTGDHYRVPRHGAFAEHAVRKLALLSRK